VAIKTHTEVAVDLSPTDRGCSRPISHRQRLQ